MVRAVFIFEPNNDLSVHPSIERAAASVEAIDVDNREYDFFAEDGTILAATTQREAVMLRVSGERRADELRDRLREYLSRPDVGIDPRLADDPVAAAQAILDAEWQRRPFQWFSWLDRRANGTTRPVV